MRQLKTFTATVLWVSLLPFVAAQAEMINKADYKAGKTRISGTYKSDRAACNTQSGNAKDICIQEAKAKEKVARAELEYSHTGKSSDRNKVDVVKAETAYAVARERCDDLSGNPKDVCIQEAKTAEKKALADAKMGKEMNDAKQDANSEKMNADYKLEMEKCDALSGDAKNNCTSAAKSKFNKK